MFSSARALGFALALTLVRADVVTEGTPIGSLYAYGSGISGLPVIYSDGKISSPLLMISALLTRPTGFALLGWGRPSIASVVTNVTCESNFYHLTSDQSSLNAQSPKPTLP